MFETKTGDVITMTSFTFVRPELSVTFKAPKGQVAVFLLLGEEPKDGSAPLDCNAVLNRLGYFRKSEKRRKKAEIPA